MTAWAKGFVEYHHSINQALGVASEFLYMGDAGEFQDPFTTFPRENLERLREVRASYDPGYAFSKLNWGGSKIPV